MSCNGLVVDWIRHWDGKEGCAAKKISVAILSEKAGRLVNCDVAAGSIAAFDDASTSSLIKLRMAFCYPDLGLR